MKVNEKGLSSH